MVYTQQNTKTVLAILNKEDVYTNVDGETSWDFCYIENTVQINLLATTSIVT